MTPTVSQLVTIREQARDTKSKLSALYGMIVSFDEKANSDGVDSDFKERMDDAGKMCDEIENACTQQLRAIDERINSKLKKAETK